MSSEKDDDLSDIVDELDDSPEPPPPEESEPMEEVVMDESPLDEAPPVFEGDPQEMWIEEYEREGRPGKPKKDRRKPRHIGRWIVLVVVVLVLVVWTLISPPVMSVVGNVYVDSDVHANLGNWSANQDIRLIASLFSVGSTTWGVSIAGNATATVDEDAVFRVMVTKVSEEAGGFWFMGTEISLRNVSFYLEDDTLVGWMTEKDEERDKSLGYVQVSFPEVGSHDCYVVLRFSVYEVMRIGFLPADKVSMTVHLSESIAVSEQTGGP